MNNLLDFARIEANRVEASYQPTDLATMTRDLASGFRAAMEGAGLELRVDCPPLGEPVFVDRDMWEKIVLNLLSNAFKFTFEGSVAVTLGVRGEHVELVVADTGTGIPAQELPHLFERFHRVRGARARTHEGSGIGLALVHELVRHARGHDNRELAPGPRDDVHGLDSARQRSPARRTDRRRANAGGDVDGRVPAYVAEASRWVPDEREPVGAADTTADGAPSGSCSRTTTRTCATTCGGSSSRAGRSRPSPTAPPRWPPPSASRRP